MAEKQYIAIDLKSFYASVECAERLLDPLNTNLVVADPSRTEKTICLAVSPSLKAYGISGRARLFEVIQRVREVNRERQKRAPGHVFTRKSCFADELASDPSLEMDFIVAPPQMAHYIEVSAEIHNIYLAYVAPEDIHVYSVDEVFIDATNYLNLYDMTAHDLAMKMIADVLYVTGITATAGIGTNLYLCKVAMDIVAKHIPPDKDGVRIAELDEMSYRQQLWDHRPLTDFWRVGRGIANKLEANGMFTMGDIARCSLGEAYERKNEDLLYKLFGVNAELLIDHAWGWEPCEIKDIKAYRPENNCLNSGQVLTAPYDYEKALLVADEMADAMALDLVKKGLVTDQIILSVGYDIENLKNDKLREHYTGEIAVDHYGRSTPKPAHGSINIEKHTSSAKQIIKAVSELFERIVDDKLLIRRITITANHVIRETDIPRDDQPQQLELFIDYEALEKKKKAEAEEREKEKRMQHALLDIKKKYGKNAILKGMNFREGATAKDRNEQIGGHKA